MNQLVSEIKQFISFYAFIMDRVKVQNIQLLNSNPDDEVQKEENQLIDKTKRELNEMYQHILLQKDLSIIPFINLCVKSII